MTRNFITAGIIGMAFATTSMAHATTMQEAMASAITTHPTVVAAEKDQAAIGHTIDMAKSGYLPKVDFAAGTGYEWSDNTSTRGRGIRQFPDSGHTRSRDLWRTESRLSVTQMLFDGFQTKSRVAQAKNRFTSAAFHTQDIRNQVALRAAEVYLGVLRAREQLALAQENLETHQQFLNKINDRIASGRSSEADRQQVQGRIALAEANVDAAQGDLQTAEGNYLEVVGEMPNDPVMGETPFGAIPTDTKAAIDIAMHNSPVIASGLADIKAANAELAEAKAVFCPRITLEGGISRNENLDGVQGPNNDMSAMVMLRQNLYNGGNDVAQRKERIERVKEAEALLEKERREVELAVIESYSRLTTAKSRLSPLSQHVQAAQATRNAYIDQFDLGQRTLLDLLDSEVELFNAKSALIDGKYETAAAAYAVLAHTGELAPAVTGNSTQVASNQ